MQLIFRMFKTNQVLPSSCLNLWRSCHCARICTNNTTFSGFTRTSKMSSNAAGLHKLLLLSKCFSIYFHGGRDQNGELFMFIVYDSCGCHRLLFKDIWKLLFQLHYMPLTVRHIPQLICSCLLVSQGWLFTVRDHLCK